MSEKRELKEPPQRYQHRRAFIVRKSALKEEEDTIIDAAVYFYPKFDELEKSYIAVRCKQLVGVPQVLKDIGLGQPTVFNFNKGFTAMRSWGDYFVYLEGRFDETQEEIENILDKMCESYIHMRGSFDLLSRTSNAFSRELTQLWDSILNYFLKTLDTNDRVFNQQQFADLQKKERNICLLQAKQILDHFVHYPDVITGAVFYHNKVIYCDPVLQDNYSELLATLAILSDQNERNQLPLKEIEVGDLLNNCTLYVFYVYKKKWTQLGGEKQVCISSDELDDLNIVRETSLTVHDQRILQNSSSRTSAKTMFSLSEDIVSKIGLKSVNERLDIPQSSSDTTSALVEESVSTYPNEAVEQINREIDNIQPLTTSGEPQSSDSAFSISSLLEGAVQGKLSVRPSRSGSLPLRHRDMSEDLLDTSPIEELEQDTGDNILKDSKFSTLRMATMKARETWLNPPIVLEEGEHEHLLTEVCLLVVSVNKLKLFLIAEWNIYKDVPLLLEIREASVTALNKLNGFVHNCILNPQTGISCKLLTFLSHDSFDNKVITSRDGITSEPVFKHNVRLMQKEFDMNQLLKGGCFSRRKNGFIARKTETSRFYYQGTKQLLKLFAEKSIPHVDALVFIEKEGYDMLPKHPRLHRHT
ncbi:hypothetical protein LOD99_9628 [Oopsacas minuta]|uniref:CCZ1/INTU/HSP4 first Longin domain-containing protein n=1 Tax=Oopsacas minuta TaxID=111878 RepID=A0AAV7KMS8_9METZ|nr:hypothetical protein LOD99_9628 [Oopsacas minuta]